MADKVSPKLWRARSKDNPEEFWIRGRTKPEVKKILRKFLKSPEYWEGEPDLEIATEIFKSYCSDICDCPGIRVDDSRGDVLLSLVNSSNDWNWVEVDKDVIGSSKKEKKGKSCN